MTENDGQKSELLSEDIGFESGLINELHAYHIAAPDPAKINGVIEELYSYVPPARSQKSLKDSGGGLARFFRSVKCVFTAMPWYYFIFAAATCFCSFVFGSRTAPGSMLFAAVLLPPVPIVISILLFSCKRDKNMAEFLQTCLFDYRQLIAARLFVMAVYSLGIDLAVLLLYLVPAPFSAVNSLIFCFSLVASLLTALLFIRRLWGVLGAAVICFCWVAAAAVCTTMDFQNFIYALDPLYLFLGLILCGLFVIREFTNLPGKIEKNLRLGNTTA